MKPSYVTMVGTTMQFDLSNATYDPATKTCSTVGCHVNELNPTWGRPYQYFGAEDTCNRCHPY